MTTELEKQFFECFGIEPKMLCDCEFKNLYDYSIEYGQDVCIHIEEDKSNCQDCELAKQIHPLYPKITDRKLLELIAIVAKHRVLKVYATTYQEIKNDILKTCIALKDNILNANKRFNYIDEVKALFEDKEQ